MSTPFRANIYYASKAEHDTAKAQARAAGFRSLSAYLWYLTTQDAKRLKKDAK
jgi:hypothetical protein